MNIVFAGTPSFALPCLDALHQSSHHLVAIYTQPDRPAGRGHHLQASPVKQWAEAQHIPVYQPLNFKTQEAIDTLAALNPDVIVVIAYGLILPRAVLDLPRFGCINVHASLLPRWRGASPIQQAILHGEALTGITIMQMDVGLDTGDMLAKVSCPINQQTTTASLHDELSQLATVPLLHVLDAMGTGTLQPQPQDNTLATYAPKIFKEDARINWELPAVVIDRQIRAYLPWPIAYTKMSETMVKIHQTQLTTEFIKAPPGTILAMTKQGIEVATGQGKLVIQRLQFPGSKVLSVIDYLNTNDSRLQVNGVFQ